MQWVESDYNLGQKKEKKTTLEYLGDVYYKHIYLINAKFLGHVSSVAL